jgi:hypothetical protein
MVLPKSWWDTWENYVSGPENELPGIIDAADILLDPSTYGLSKEKPNKYTNFILKPGLRGDIDYKLVSPTIWKMLVQKYHVKPGSILRRYSIAINEVET